MYQPRHFQQDEIAACAELMKQFPLATLVHIGPDGAPVANLIPMLWQAGGADSPALAGALLGHVARANPLWKEAAGQEVLVLFHGPQAYVSPNWYPSKAEAGKAVPTWNYCVVQARGKLQVFDDPARLTPLLSELTAVHEAGQPHPWTLQDAPAEYLEAMQRAIVGFEIQVTRLEGKWKVSQNRPAPDREGVAAGLRRLHEGLSPAKAMARWVDSEGKSGG